jgi:hypothetical protein
MCYREGLYCYLGGDSSVKERISCVQVRHCSFSIYERFFTWKKNARRIELVDEFQDRTEDK